MANNTTINQVISRINQLINDQINTIIHHRTFQELEASWRGLENLVVEIGMLQNPMIKIKVLHLALAELNKDLTIENIDFDQSEFFKLIYTSEFDLSGGEPFSVIIADYRFSHKVINGIDSVNVLQEMTKAAASAFSVLLTGADATLLEIDHWADIQPYLNIPQTLKNTQHARWKKLCQMHESQFLGLIAPRILVRPTYQQSQAHTRNVFFHEQITQTQHHLWGNPAYRYVSAIVRSFHETGWFLQIRQPLQTQLHYERSYSLIDSHHTMSLTSTECYVTDAIEQRMNEAGLIALREHKISLQQAFYCQHSLHQAKVYSDDIANQNAYLSAQLPYVLCCARLSQTLKAIMRDKTGSYQTAEQCEAHLQQWLMEYCASADAYTPQLHARYPLSEAKVRIRSDNNRPGHYRCITQLKPHCTLSALECSLKMSSPINLNLSPQAETTHA